MSHEKDISILEDRLNRVDAQLQKALKEKSAILSSSSAKDREISELLHKETLLKSNVSQLSSSLA